jgi:hypothetical protein
LLVAVVRRIEAVGNYLLLYYRYIEKVATDVIRRARTCAEVGGEVVDIRGMWMSTSKAREAID